jgi:glycerophosphoryl diester phosphodiesterase
MAAFRSAVAVGAHAIETDLHLSKDGVVVLSHVCLPLLHTRTPYKRRLAGGTEDRSSGGTNEIERIRRNRVKKQDG